MTDSKKIVFLVSFMNVAGAQEAAMRVARGLRGRGYDAEVWFFYREAEVPRFRSEPWVKVLVDTENPGAAGYAKIAVRLLSELGKAKPYATVSFLPLANVLGQAMALVAGVKRRIASARSPVSTYGRIMRIGDKLNARLGVYRRIVAVTREVGAGYRSMPSKVRQRVSVVYNGIVWQRSPLSKADARAKLGLPADGFFAASVGRFKEQKNYPFQAEIAARLYHSAIVVAGDGPLREQTEARMQALNVGNRMILLGNLAKEDIAHLLAACDVFIQPSLYEGQSNALLEAMHQGMPVLVSDVADQRETIVDDLGTAGGLLIGLDDPQPWAAALDRLATEPVERDRWEQASRQRAKEYTLERQLDGFAAAIDHGDGRTADAITSHLDILADETLADRLVRFIASRHGAAVVDLNRSPTAPHDRNVSMEDIADLVYSYHLIGRADLLTEQVADRVASRLQQTRLAGRLSGEPPQPLERAIVHRTAYGLGTLALLKRAGHDRFAAVLQPDQFALEEIVDSATSLPRFPAKYTHHNWRVSHWIGGVPSILFNLESHGDDAVRATLTGAFTPQTVLAACARAVDPKTGLLRLYKAPALQWIFRNLYRIRHDPDLGDLGGIAHLIWVQHAMGAPLVGAQPLYDASKAELIKHEPFMEDMPYCLDFDIIENARVAGERLGAVPGDSALAERARKLYDDTRNFYLGTVPANYTLHKIPGAIAGMHEAAFVASDLAAKLATDLRAERAKDIIRDALWI